MFRQGRNTKDTHTADDTADHTPSSSSSYGGGPSSAQTPGGSQSATPTEAYQQQVYTQTTSRAVTESESLARDIKEGTLTGFVGNGTTLTGEANFKGMLRVDGTLSGRVSSDDGTLIVSTNGRVEANVEVAVAQIFGTVNGDITASKRIEMGRVAKVTGNIQTPALVIENGAVFEGSCRMVQLKEAAERGPSAATGKSDSASASTSSSPSSSPSSSGNASSSAAGASSSAKPSTGGGSSSPTSPDAKGASDAAGQK
ncbi:MAG TPA: polymer-forming cytoskeletal protein [Pyrinomonadaceae bacterium]|jgi:cytoskeletal protein CcmA (bactofilin family)|nr:polymer-forming cytoskeletal protein [Pyrinomonadaceae bacterium]